MPLHLDSDYPQYKFAYEDASPDSGDVMTWNSSRNRMVWGAPSLSVTLPFMFDDSAEESFTYTPPEGSFVSGDHHDDVTLSVSGGGLIGNLSLDQGVFRGPTDGTEITITGRAFVQTLIDSDSTHDIETNPFNDSDTDTDTVRLRVIDKTVIPSIALVTRPVRFS